jgi:hypothetical protein
MPYNAWFFYLMDPLDYALVGPIINGFDHGWATHGQAYKEYIWCIISAALYLFFTQKSNF